MENADDFYPSGRKTIKNDVFAHRKAPNALFQFISGSTDIRIFSKSSKFLIYGFKKGVSLGFAVVSNKFSYFGKISACTESFPNKRHLGFLSGSSSSVASRSAFFLERLKIPWRGFAAFEALSNRLAQLLKLFLAPAVLLLHEPQGFADDLALGVVKPGLDFLPHHPFKLRRQMYVHKRRPPAGVRSI